MCMFFFFKQKTAYEMRISDWSSDVCSSDLACDNQDQAAGSGDQPSFRQELLECDQHGQKCDPREVHHAPHEQQRHQQPTAAHAIGAVKNAHAQRAGPAWPIVAAQERSEEHTSELQSLMRLSYAVFCLK